MSGVTLGSRVIRVLVMRNASTNIGFELVISLRLHRTLLGLQIRIRDLTCRLTKPAFETRLAESCVIAGNQCALAHFHTVVARVRVSHHFARILACGQAASDEFIKTKPFRPSYFNGAIHWWARRDSVYSTGDIVGRHWLDERRWQPHFVAFG